MHGTLERAVCGAFLALACGCGTAVVGAEGSGDAAGPVPRLLFGIGPEADGAIGERLARETPLWMLTSWYNGSGDLAWISGWKDNLVPQAYERGYALHLVVAISPEESPIETVYGMACGRGYPLSDGFLGDMAQLADTFAGPAAGPPLYVTLFNAVDAFGCTDSAFNPDPETNAYHRALSDRFREALAVFHDRAPNSRVSLGWRGGQVRSDDPAILGGRSMFGAYADVLAAADFQSFEAMDAESNIENVRATVESLGSFGPVMLAYHKPAGNAAGVFATDIQAMLTDQFLSNATARGLFAWSFLDAEPFPEGSAAYAAVERAVRRYGAAP